MAISISIVKFSFFLYIIVSSIFATFYLLYLNHESSYAQHRIEPRSTVIREQQRQIPFHNQIEHYNVMRKAFATALGPSRIVPHYIRAKARAQADDVTILTLVTRDRLDVLGRLATRYQGPISVAMHVSEQDAPRLVRELEEFVRSNEFVEHHVDFHLIIDVFDRQLNMWRNVAKLFAQSEYVMMIDVDFYLSTLPNTSLRAYPDLMQKIQQGRAAAVVPAFEYVLEQGGKDPAQFPRRKQDLVKQWQSNKIEMFHSVWQAGHGATNYTKWIQATQPYKVTNYTYSYEPYIVFKKNGTPWCDERFIGYGSNKAACLYEIYLSGVDFFVLPHDFIIHQTHSYPEETRTRERSYNRKLYRLFREETCLKYARKMIAADEWRSSRSANLRHECSKIKTFQTLVSPYLAETDL